MRGHDIQLPTVKFEFNKRNFIVSTFDCVYTDLVLSGCVVIFMIFTEVYRMISVSYTHLTLPTNREV